MPTADSSTTQLLSRIGEGDPSAINALLDLHRAYLMRLVELQMEPRLRQRIDPSDVVQETQLEIVQRMDDYLRRRPMSFRVWLRKTACQRIGMLRRFHLKAQVRNGHREVTLPDASSLFLARQMRESRPSHFLEDRERAAQVRNALETLNETDREIILMRTFERLGNQEAAEVLEIDPATASKRYGRALLHLKDKLAEVGFNSQT